MAGLVFLCVAVCVVALLAAYWKEVGWFFEAAVVALGKLLIAGFVASLVITAGIGFLTWATKEEPAPMAAPVYCPVPVPQEREYEITRPSGFNANGRWIDGGTETVRVRPR